MLETSLTVNGDYFLSTKSWMIMWMTKLQWMNGIKKYCSTIFLKISQVHVDHLHSEDSPGINNASFFQPWMFEMMGYHLIKRFKDQLGEESAHATDPVNQSHLSLNVLWLSNCHDSSTVDGTAQHFWRIFWQIWQPSIVTVNWEFWKSLLVGYLLLVTWIITIDIYHKWILFCTF